MSRTPLTGGTLVQAPILPEYQESNYPTHFDIYGSGGLRGVANILAISQLPVGYLSIGMIVIAQDTMFAYQYTGVSSSTVTGTVVATSQSVTLTGWVTFVTSSGASGGTVNFNNGVSGTLSTINGGTGTSYTNFAALATAIATQIGLQTVNGIVKSNGSGTFSAAGSADITSLPLTGFVSTAGTITPTTTILQAIEYLSAAGTSNGGGTTVTGLLAGNGSAIVAATAAQVTGNALTGYSAGSVSGTVQATDTILQAITKLAGSSSNPLTTQLTGYTTLSGTVSATDTILQAIEKLQNAVTALSGGTLAAHTLFYGTVPAATYGSQSAALSYLTSSVVSGTGTQAVGTLTTAQNNANTTFSYTVPGTGGWVWLAAPTADIGTSLTSGTNTFGLLINGGLNTGIPGTSSTSVTISGIAYTIIVFGSVQTSNISVEWHI